MRSAGIQKCHGRDERGGGNVDADAVVFLIPNGGARRCEQIEANKFGEAAQAAVQRVGETFGASAWVVKTRRSASRRRARRNAMSAPAPTPRAACVGVDGDATSRPSPKSARMRGAFASATVRSSRGKASAKRTRQSSGRARSMSERGRAGDMDRASCGAHWRTRGRTISNLGARVVLGATRRRAASASKSLRTACSSSASQSPMRRRKVSGRF